MKRARFPTRKILVVSPAQLSTAVAVLKTVPVDAANPIEIRIGEQVKGRNKDQNALMWAGPLRDIANQAYVNGQTYSADVWHEHFKREFLPEEADIELTREGYQKWRYLPSGERILKASTGDLTTKGFSIYLEHIYAYGASLGVQFGVSERMFA